MTSVSYITLIIAIVVTVTCLRGDTERRAADADQTEQHILKAGDCHD